MIGRTNTGGGGGGLNFRVLSGTSAPASPKTNDIWVNTSVDIPEWTFAASDPYTVDIYKTGIVEQGLYIKLDTGEEYAHELYSTVTVNLPENTQSITVPADNASTTTVAHAFYDADGELISTVQRLPNTVTYEVPSGAVMAKVSYYQTDTKAVIANINLPEGAVWISTGTYNSVEFNALKKNGIQVYPISAKQYISGAWVDVDAKSYQGGAWVDLRWRANLFDNGTMHVTLESANNGGSNAGSDSNSLRLMALGVGYGYWVTDSPIDLTNASRLYADVVRDSGSVTSLWIGIVSSKTSTSPVASISLTPAAAVDELCYTELGDIPDGEYYVKAYIQVAAGNTAALHIYKLYIE